MVHSGLSMLGLPRISEDAIELQQIALDLIVNRSGRSRDAEAVRRTPPLATSQRQSEICVPCPNSSRGGAGKAKS